MLRGSGAPDIPAVLPFGISSFRFCSARRVRITGIYMQRSVLAVAVALATSAHCAAQDQIAALDEVVVTASRFKDRIDDKPVNMTVITGEDIRRSAAKTVPDLLSEQAGIQIHDFYGNNAATTTVDLRGFGITGTQNTLILVDGRRVVDNDLSGVQWSAVPLNNVERIEIMRGGGSVMYGDGAVGGVINIITRSPFDGPGTVSLRARAGSYGTTESGFTAQYRSERLGIGFAANNLETDGYRVNNQNRQTTGAADLRLLTDGGEVGIKLATDHQGLRLPGARQVQPSTGVNLLATNRRGTPTPLDYSQRNGNRMTVDWQQRAGGGDFNIGGGWRNKEQISYFDFSGSPDYRVADLDVLSFTPRVRWSPDLPGGSHTMVAGFDWYHWDYNLKRSNSTTNIGTPFNVIDARQQNTGVYLQDTLKVSPRLTMTAGVRYERFNADATDTYNSAAPGGAFGSGAPAGSQDESEHAYEVGARYGLTPEVSLIGKTARSFRFANIDEIYETTTTFTNQFQFLRPQTAKHHELGAEWRQAGKWLRASLFQIDVEDEIHLDAYTTGTGNTNLPPSRRRGLELESKWQATRMLSLLGAYTYTDAEFLSGVLPGAASTQRNVSIAGKTVPLVPRHKLNLGGSWAFTQNTRLSAMVSYTGEQFMDNDEGNTLGVKIPAYTVTDLKLSHRQGDWTLSAAINNLFDRQYYNYAVRSQFVLDRYNAYPLPERNASVTVEYVFR
jgi:iron complex outermembrane receptor protein